jgi:hypothetical protein
MGAALCRPALAGDVPHWSCRCVGNKIFLTGESAIVRMDLFALPSEINEEGQLLEFGNSYYVPHCLGLL